MPKLRPLRLHTLATLAVVLTAAPASATKMLVLARSSGSGGDKAASYATYVSRYLLSEDGRYDVVDLPRALGDAPENPFAEPDNLVAQAQTAYETLDLDPAVEHLRKALTQYEKNAAHLTDIKRISSALLLLGAVHILRGEEKMGAERLLQALAVDRDVEPDPRVFNPSMRQQFQRASDQLASRRPGKLVVTSTPSYAEVWVDGQFRGITPYTIDGLRDGKHYVRIVKDGYEPAGAVMQVGPGREVTHNATLKAGKKLNDLDAAANEAAVSRRPDDTPPNAVLALKKLVAADHAFIAEVRVDGDRVTLTAAQYDMAAQRHLKTASKEFPFADKAEIFQRELSDLLRTQFGETTLVKKTEPAPPPPGTTVASTPTSSNKKLALGIGIGGGVLFGGVGALLEFLALRDNNEFRLKPQASADAEALQSSGRTKAMVGDILMVLGVAALGTGLGLYFMWEPSGGDAAGGSATLSFVPLDGGGAVLLKVGD